MIGAKGTTVMRRSVFFLTCFIMLSLRAAESPTTGTTAATSAESVFAIPYALAQDGWVTLAVNGADGARVRNLEARVSRNAGAQQVQWDLRDERGNWIEPGVYRLLGITHPGLSLRYEMTVYPNVSQLHPENAPWLTGEGGAGGWLADHTPPYGAASDGTNVYFSSPVPEDGTGFVACDASGRRLWGIRSFGFSGARRLAADGRFIYAENFGPFAYKGADYGDRVWRVDRQTHTAEPFLMARDTETRRRGIAGMAAAGGYLYLSIRAPMDWLASATDAGAVDIDQCLPAYRPAGRGDKTQPIPPDCRNDFLRLFRLQGTPPGYASNHGLVWLRSTRSNADRQYILLTFKRPVPIGSVAYPVPSANNYRTSLSILKPDAPYPPDPERDAMWTPFADSGTQAWDVVAAPEQAMSRALRIVFERENGATDLEDEGIEDASSDDTIAGTTTTRASSGPAWEARLEGLRILRRRFRNHTAEADVRVNSGTVDAAGIWTAQRQEPLSPEHPGVYVMEWKNPVILRGLAIREVDGKDTEVDVWTGAPSGTIPLQGTDGWTTVARFTPTRRIDHVGFAQHNALARYLDSMVDFGGDYTTRAVRIRVCSQWTENERRGNCAYGGLGLDVTRCRIFGVAALESLGGEPDIDPLVAERIEVIDASTKKTVREIAIRRPGALAVSRDGTLFACSENAIVRVADDGKHGPLITDLRKPTTFALDPEGSFYVFDAAPDRRNIRVYDRSGQYLRSIGEAGGYQVGPWNPNRLHNVTGIAIGPDGAMWAADSTPYPKRVSRWTRDGAFEREYLGPTAYGGDGVLDPQEPSRLIIGPMEFELDRKQDTSRLKNLLVDTFSPGRETGGMEKGLLGEVPVRVGGRLYCVNRPSFSRNSLPCGAVYRYDTDHLTPVAAVGIAKAFPPICTPPFMIQHGGSLDGLNFIWSDTNGNGQPEPEEVDFSESACRGLGPFAEDLSIVSGTTRYGVASFTQTGVPIYRRTPLPEKMADSCRNAAPYALGHGWFYLAGASGKDIWLDAQGKVRCTYATGGMGVGALKDAGPFRPEQVTCQFSPVGHAVATQGDLGEFFVVSSNLGTWNIWTADGLLAGRLFEDFREKNALPWSMPDHQRGLDLSHATLGQEHFMGWFCRERDGRYTAVAGHHHASLVAVEGLDNFTRFGAEVRVTSDDIAAARRRERRTAQETTKAVAAVAVAEAFRTPPTLDGDLREWEGRTALVLGDADRRVMIGWDHDCFYLAYDMTGCGPLDNTGTDWRELFHGGGGIDLMIATDPHAAPGREMPVAGDKRLYITRQQGKPVAVLYEAVAAGAAPDAAWSVRSPVGETTFDRVVRIPVRLGYQETADAEGHVFRYVAEAAIPWTELGLTAVESAEIRGDFGILETDDGATIVRQRVFWSNPLAQILSDLPSEARLYPDLWGTIRLAPPPKEKPMPGMPGLSEGSEDPSDIPLTDE